MKNVLLNLILTQYCIIRYNLSLFTGSMVNYITWTRNLSILFLRNIATIIILVSACIGYIAISCVFIFTCMEILIEYCSFIATQSLLYILIMGLLFLPLWSTDLSVLLLKGSLTKSNIVRLLIDNTLSAIFIYFSAHFNYYFKPVLDFILECKLLCLFLNFMISMVDYFQYLKQKIFTANKLGYLLAFGLLLNVDPSYYYMVFTWYYFTVSLSYIVLNKEILSSHPYIRKWLINLLTINIMILEVTLLSSMAILVSSKLKLIFDYILKMFGRPFNGNGNSGNSNSPGPSSNKGGPNGNNPNDPFSGSLGVNNNNHNSSDDNGSEEYRDNNTNRNPEQSEEEEDVFAMFTYQDTYGKTKDQIRYPSRKQYFSDYRKANKEHLKQFHKTYQENNSYKIKKTKKTLYSNKKKDILTNKKAAYAEDKKKATEKYVQEQAQMHEQCGADPITALAIATNKPKQGKVPVRIEDIETGETSIHLSQSDAGRHLELHASAICHALNTNKIVKKKFKLSWVSEIDEDVNQEIFQGMKKNYQSGIPISIKNVITGEIKLFSSKNEASKDKDINLNSRTITNHMNKGTLAKKIYKIDKI